VNIESIQAMYKEYPTEFVEFCGLHNLHPPKIDSGNGLALAAMLHNPSHFWDRKSCDVYVEKFEIKTKDSIQLFNKHEQWGIKTSIERGKNYILYPYELSNKHKMRKNFSYDGTEEQKNTEIDKIKSTIHHDYVEVPNSEWQLGHKNPESEDNTATNLVLQPPIQAKYRDQYIFIDTLTKIPTPTTLKKMHESGNSPYTLEQWKQLKELVLSMTDLTTTDLNADSNADLTTDQKTESIELTSSTV